MESSVQSINSHQRFPTLQYIIFKISDNNLADLLLCLHRQVSLHKLYVGKELAERFVYLFCMRYMCCCMSYMVSMKHEAVLKRTHKA